MKLINRLTIWYLAITTLVLLVSGFIVFHRVQSEIETEVGRRLKRNIDHVAGLIKDGVPVDSIQTKEIEIKVLPFEAPLIKLQVKDSMGYFALPLRAVDRKYSVASSYKIAGQHYYISAHNFIAEPDEIFEGILASLGFTLVILLAFVTLASRQMSTQLLSNFNRTLKTIQSFTLKQNDPIKLTNTKIREFKELNRFLEKMTNKALDDYRSLKEFSENASHELQTPLAIMRGKLELLLDTNIDERQATLIEGIQDAVQKLASVNQSLILLTRLENQEYHLNHKINFTEVVEEGINAFKELIEMKSIKITADIQPAVYVNLHPVLAHILFTNLLSNAIRHNQPNGSINVFLSSSGLTVSNSGDPPKISTAELFQRFKKGKQSGESTGLGLAIVKQICEASGFNVSYEFSEGRHILEIVFLPNT
jgi:signal transduction histidine kinase